MTYECEDCGLVVDDIEQFKENECPDDIQHHFKKQEST